MFIPTAPVSPSDLPLVDGRVYHLDLAPSELAPNIIIVGDPERVPLICREHFTQIEVERAHRGLRSATGIASETGQRVSVITSGMGTPSLEIVLNEIVALNCMDFDTRLPRKSFDLINIIRVGTSGALSAATKLGTPIISAYAVGLDNTGVFYQCPPGDPACLVLEERVRTALERGQGPEARFRGAIVPYAAKASEAMLSAMQTCASRLGVPTLTGVTVSASGFFNNQGRQFFGVPATVPDIDGVLGELETGIAGLRFENMEMEASFLLHYMSGLGFNAGAICPAVANRRLNTFDPHSAAAVLSATRVALHTLSVLSNRVS